MKVEAKHIPPEVVEAATKALLFRSAHESEAVCRAFARAALAAGLAAWPGAGEQYTGWNRRLILPLPQEANDAE